MSQRNVVLKSNANNIVTLTYESFNWERFKATLEALGLEVTKDDKIPCG